MSDVIELGDGGRVDVASQKMLTHLRKGGWIYTGDLRKTAELSQNSQVLYRLEEHLMPADFVIEADREREEEPRKFQLSASGQIWVDNHEEELSFPASRVETQEMAYEAIEAAESAKNSVQNYRKKVYRLKKKVEGLDEQVEENSSGLTSHGASIDVLNANMAQKTDLRAVRRELESFQEEMEEKHELEVDDLGGRLDAQEIVVGELREEVERLRDENAHLRSKVREIREELDRGVLERILNYFQGKR